jgi:hypothetical protein
MLYVILVHLCSISNMLYITAVTVTAASCYTIMMIVRHRQVHNHSLPMFRTRESPSTI